MHFFARKQKKKAGKKKDRTILSNNSAGNLNLNYITFMSNYFSYLP